MRVRPALSRELTGYREYQCVTLADANSITISENLAAVLHSGYVNDGHLYATYRWEGSSNSSTAVHSTSLRSVQV